MLRCGVLIDRVSVGTGLGRDLRLIDQMPFLLEGLGQRVSVCDADFFWYLVQDLPAHLKRMRPGRGWVFTPNKREFVKIFSALNKKPFGFSIIETFLDCLDDAVFDLESDSSYSETFEVPFGEDANGDGVGNLEDLGKSERQLLEAAQASLELDRVFLSRETVRVHRLGRQVQVGQLPA